MIRLSKATVTRPNNATQYAAGDVVGPAAGDAMEFNVETPGAVVSAILIDSAAEATKPDIDLLLFDEEPTVANDNEAFAPTDDQMKDHCIGVIVFDKANFRTGGAGNGVINATAFGSFPFGAVDRKIYGVMVARNTYTPFALEEITIKLGIVTA